MIYPLLSNYKKGVNHKSHEIDMDILDVSDLNRHTGYMSSVGNRIINKHLYIDRETGNSLPFDYEKMMSDNEYYSFTTYFLSHQRIAWWKSKQFIEKVKVTQ